jgi:alkylation response protein AidB-like acyl-CoA dehydrogenase
VVGGVDNGWAVAQSLLGVERGEEAATNPILFKTEIERLIELARLYGKDQDPVIRRRIAWCWSKVEIMRYLGYRVLTGWLKGAQPGPEASVSKLFWSDYHTKVTDLAMDIMGMHAQVPVGRPPPATAYVPNGRPRGSELRRLMVGDLPDRLLRHPLRRDLAGPAQHPRREGPRPPGRAPHRAA